MSLLMSSAIAWKCFCVNLQHISSVAKVVLRKAGIVIPCLVCVLCSCLGQVLAKPDIPGFWCVSLPEMLSHDTFGWPNEGNFIHSSLSFLGGGRLKPSRNHNQIYLVW